MSPVSNTVRGKNLFDKAYMYESVARELAELKEKYRWRDAVKEPPKNDGQYLVIDQENLCRTLFYFKGTGWVDEEYPVTHWMLLPLPPERSGE
jgi:hypothetical protein